MNIVFFGAPGAGKGTQSAYLVTRKKMLQVSTGDLLRSAIKSGSELGLRAKVFMDKGDLVPDTLVIDLVKKFVSDNNGASFIFDGFPRTVNQASALSEALSFLGQKIDRAIFLEVVREEIVRRLTGRRTCSVCQSIYHIEDYPSKNHNICDKCGGTLVQRADDSIGIIENRLSNYDNYTKNLKDYYKNEGVLIEIDGNQNSENVYQAILNSLK